MNFEKQDARLGLLVLAALALFAGLVAYKNAGAVTERTYPLVVRLDQMEGLAPGPIPFGCISVCVCSAGWCGR